MATTSVENRTQELEAPTSKMTFQEVITRATKDEGVLETVASINRLRAENRNPSKTELDAMKLRPLGYLVAAGELRALPGGGASPLAMDVMEDDVRARLSSATPGSRIDYLFLTHGALNPNIPHQSDMQGVNREVNEKLRYENFPLKDFALRNVDGMGYIGNHVHEEMCCGVPGGQADNTRELAHANLTSPRMMALHEAAAERGVSLTITSAEAVVPVNSNTPLFRIFDKGPKESEDRYREEHRDPMDYPLEKLLSIDQFNGHIQSKMNQGHIVMGVGCSDYRQGHSVPHESVGSVALDQVGEAYERKRVKKGRPTTKYQGVGHTEDYAVNLSGRSEAALANYVFALQHPAAIVRKGVEVGGIQHVVASPSGPFPISLPEGMHIPDEAKEAMAGLVSRLNAAQYDRLLLQNPVTTYKEIDGKLHEIDMPRGFQLIDPEKGLSDVRPGRVMMAGLNTREPVIPSNPKEGYTYPARREQGLGFIVPGTRRSWGAEYTKEKAE